MSCLIRNPFDIVSQVVALLVLKGMSHDTLWTPCVKRIVPLTRKIEPGKGSIFDFSSGYNHCLLSAQKEFRSG
ncbi:hypothetical protein DesyoDRAFT_0797 [Desulfosporosinus youngiae DSM 17734]|uniref:Uncharacterized protein n=1 Tax=Desulfosporosinus youngiae DSM 17734 TaxID=768710 RepID=H5XT09_9FIRM|nr:hypothetical protein DesyoDRAFT_0797 [Desulfosporosinus youngiae DSM 17734]